MCVCIQSCMYVWIDGWVIERIYLECLGQYLAHQFLINGSFYY